MELEDQFEWFANYCIVNKEYDSVRFELKNILTGCGTPGIDGLAIIVNNKLCSTVQEIKDLMKERNPICKLYYVCNGSWQNDSTLVTIIENNKVELDQTNLFEKIEFQPCDSKKLQYLYRKTKEPNSAKIHFEKKVTLPSIPGVQVAYSGLLPFSEYRNIIIDDDGNMKSVYDDNIRDYLEQDDNPVNKDINDTFQIIK